METKSKATVLKNLLESISISSYHRDGGTVSFFFRLNNQTLVLFNHEMNKQGFIFKGIWRWPVINLATLIRGYPYLISLKIVVDFNTLRSLIDPGQFKCVLRETRYHVPITKLLIWNL